MRTRPASGLGFTLIELLVVVALIALLIAILMPALQQAKEAAARAKCLSGTRQVMIATKSYQSDNAGWFPRSGPTWHSPSYGAHHTLVIGNYAYQNLFTNQGCPYGPTGYDGGYGNEYYSTTPGTTAFGINTLLQVGYAYNGTMMTSYYSPTPTYYPMFGQFNDRWKRLQRRPDKVFVSACSVAPNAMMNTTMAYPGAGLQNTLGITSFYFGYAPIPGRHMGEGLPMTFYDGHGRWVPKDEIYPFIPGPPHSIMSWSLTSMYQYPDLDGTL